jgi:hypothetical protein
MSSTPSLTLTCYGSDPIGTTRTFTATSDEGSYIWLYFDGTLVAQGYDQVNYTVTGSSVATHTIEATATNGCESATATCTWNIIYDPCLAQGADINSQFDQYRCCPNNDWTNAICHHNAILRVVWGNLGSGLADKLSQCQWRMHDVCPSQSFIPPQEYNKTRYLVSIVGYDEYGNPSFQHDVVAENTGNLEHFTDYRFFQYSNKNIIVGQLGEGDTFIQMPKGIPNHKTEVTVMELTNLIVDCPTNSISYRRGIDSNYIKTFLIDENGVVT